MLHKNSIWQNSGNNWQSLFIRENFLSLGHIAWQGFITQGQGIVVCRLAVEDIESVDWKFDLVEYESHFLNELEVGQYLRLLNLKNTAIELLMDKVRDYDPEKEILLLIKENDSICLALLQNMAVYPPNCFQQIQQRESEFQLNISPPGGIYQ